MNHHQTSTLCHAELKRTEILMDASIETKMILCSFICNIRKHQRYVLLHFANCDIDQRLSMCYDIFDAKNMRLLTVNVKCITFVKQ